MKILSKTTDASPLPSKGFGRALRILALSATASLLLSGCFNSNNDDYTPPSTSTRVATQLADSTPGKLDDPAALKNDLNRLFGNPDDEPVDVKEGDTLKNIFNRSGT